MSRRVSSAWHWIKGSSKRAGKPSAKSLTTATSHAVEPLERRVLLSVFTPSQMKKAYGIDQISFGGTAGDGSNQTIAIVVAFHNPSLVSSVSSFNTTNSLQQFGSGGPSLTVVDQTGGTSYPTEGSQAWDDEECLDVEWAHAIAPKANIVVVEAASFTSSNDFQDMYAAEAEAASYNSGGGNVTVVSNSWDTTETSGESTHDSTFTTPSTKTGVTFLVAAGDNGAQGQYPSMSPNVISVGGTSLSVDSSGNWNGTESVWSNNLGAGGGGDSQYESQGSYQNGADNGLGTVSGTAYRATPDVSMDGDPNTGVDIVDTARHSGVYQTAGTSLATPMWAALIAIANQGRQILNSGTANPLSTSQALSSLYGDSPSFFHDITSGNNGYPAVSGYDLASGRGSPAANLLVPALAGYSIGTHLAFASPPTITITAGTSALPALTVDINNSSGGLITTDNSAATMSVYDGDASGVTVNGGSVTVNAVSGVATFNDLWITAPPNRAGPYQLVVTDGSDVAAVFSFTVAAAPVRNSTPTLTTLASLNGSAGTNKGAYPYGGLVLDSAGDLFGTTHDGGTDGAGSVFEINSAGVYSTLYSFTGGSDGSNPTGAVTLDPSGNIYGTTEYGGDYGSSYGGFGVVFKLSGTNYGTFTKLASFSGTSGIGANPFGKVTFDSGGNLYGTTTDGGSSAAPSGYGTVFKIASGSTTITTVASFANTNGAAPSAGVVFDSTGNLYGTTTTAYFGGATVPGNVFTIAAGSSTITSLFFFGGSSGATPDGDLAVDGAGNVYGTTESGGASGDGTVFELDNGANAVTTLTSFSGSNGANPYAGAAIDSTGNIFGTTRYGGSSDAGTAFEIAAGSNTITTLESFTGSGTVGDYPYYGTVVVDNYGNLYGTTLQGGTSNYGTVFKLALVASAARPAWLKLGSAATWDPSTQALTAAVSGSANFGKAVIIADPGTDAPIITVSASTDELEFEVPPGTAQSNAPVPINIGSLTVDSGAAAAIWQTAKPDVLQLNLTGLTLSGSGGSQGTLDIGNNRLLLTYGSGTDPIASIRGYITTAINSIEWNGPGINSSAANANYYAAFDGQAQQTTGIGYADSADGTGTNAHANSIEVVFTLYGDANLSLGTGADDFTILAAHYNQTTGGTWDTGDFNYDGSINFNDFTLLTRTYNTSFGSPSSAPATELYSLSFAGQTTYAVGSHPVGLATADVNGDGVTDLIVTNGFSGTIGVLLGNGDGTFAPEQTYAVGALPTNVKIADVNGDGKPDLIVADYFGGTVSVLLGNGDGTFQAQHTLATGAYPFSVAVGDVNGDGKPDLVVANVRGPSSVSILLGNGDGTFQAQQTLAAGATPKDVVIADVNGDGKPDLVVDDYIGSAANVLLGNGDGTFQSPLTFATATRPQSITVADLNGDGKPDLVTCNKYGSVSVLLGNGNGTFQSQHTFAVGSGPRGIIAADMNGDGIPDLVVTYNGAVAVLVGNGDGTFQAQQTFAGGNEWGVAVADFNNDGKLDIALATFSSSNTISVLLNTSTY